MSKCVLHIGMHKTGSTSIQETLNAVGGDAQFCYLQLRHANHSVELRRLFGFRGWGDSRETLNLIEQTIRSLSGRTLVVSAEDISSFDIQSLNKLASFFAERFSEIEVIGYVRPPASYAQSAFQQNVKNFTHGATAALPRIRYRNFRDTFEKFDKILGRKNVRLFKYDPPRFRDGCVVSHFCQELGWSVSNENIVRSNEAICRLTAQAIFCYNRHFPFSAQNHIRLDPIFRIIDSTKFTVLPSVLKRLVESNIEDLAWMEERLGESLHESFRDDTLDDSTDASQLLQVRAEHMEALRVLTSGRTMPKSCGSSSEEVALMVREILSMTDPRAKPAPDQWAEVCRDIALKIERGSSANLSDALSLMRIAKEIRPSGPVINSKILQWENALESRREPS